MNDPVEGYNDIYPECRENVFASSWTAEERDELPMWKFYSDLKGVRIRMPIDLFNFNDQLIVDKRENIFLIKSSLKQAVEIERVDYKNLPQTGPIKTSSTKSVFGPTAVTYHETKEAVCKGMVIPETNGPDRYQINLTLIGGRKLDYWNFEKEYRYRIFYQDALRIYGNIHYLKQFSQDHNVIQSYFDIEFKPESLDEVEVVVGPHANRHAEEQITELLLFKGLTNYTVKRSNLEINAKM